MTQKPYYRDIWCLGTGTGYPGAFPRGLVEKVLQRWNGERKLMLFSGSFRKMGWETVDIKPENNPTYVLNAEHLPDDWTEKYDLVFADPPYSEQEAKSLYDLPYFNVVKVVNEMARVTRAGGYMIFLHRLIPQNFPGDTAHFKRMKLSGIVGVFTIAGYSNIRALTVWRKMETFEFDQDNFLKPVLMEVSNTYKEISFTKNGMTSRIEAKSEMKISAGRDE